MTEFSIHSIATIYNGYDEKFGVPRQSGLSKNIISRIEFNTTYDNEDYVRELETFSHLWLIFVFHKHINTEPKATVRPPRLGGNKRIGVFASRSPFRPNSLGLSVVKIEKIAIESGSIQLFVSGADLMNGTPIVDIKPYVAYADSLPNANSSYAKDKPEAVLNIAFSDNCEQFLLHNKSTYPKLREIIIETLELDPRPSYIQETEKVFGLSLFGLNIKWGVCGKDTTVISIDILT